MSLELLSKMRNLQGSPNSYILCLIQEVSVLDVGIGLLQLLYSRTSVSKVGAVQSSQSVYVLTRSTLIGGDRKTTKRGAHHSAASPFIVQTQAGVSPGHPGLRGSGLNDTSHQTEDI